MTPLRFGFPSDGDDAEAAVASRIILPTFSFFDGYLL